MFLGRNGAENGLKDWTAHGGTFYLTWCLLNRLTTCRDNKEKSTDVMREWMSEQQKCVSSPVSLWGNVRKVTAFTNTAANSLITRGNYQNSSSFSTHMLPSNLHLYTLAPQPLQISLLNRPLSRSSLSTPSASYFYPAPTLFGDTSTSKVLCSVQSCVLPLSHSILLLH